MGAPAAGLSSGSWAGRDEACAGRDPPQGSGTGGAWPRRPHPRPHPRAWTVFQKRLGKQLEELGSRREAPDLCFQNMASFAVGPTAGGPEEAAAGVQAGGV